MNATLNELLDVNPGLIPDDLKRYPQWMVWRAEAVTRRDGTIRISKAPRSPRTLHKANKADPKNWTDFAYAFGVYEKERSRGGLHGIGFCLTRDDPFSALDLDMVLREGRLAAFPSFVVALFDSYTELSPSGTGLRIIIEGTLSGSGINKHGFEIYERNAFVTITGHIWQP